MQQHSVLILDVQQLRLVLPNAPVMLPAAFGKA